MGEEAFAVRITFLLSSNGYLANSLIDFYTLIFIYDKETRSSEAKEIADGCIESLEKYIIVRTIDSENICYTSSE